MSAKTKDELLKILHGDKCPGWKGTKETYGKLGMKFY